MSIEGNLHTLPFPDLLQLLAQGSKTGTLVIKRNGDERRIVVEEGRIVSCSSNAPEDYLGTFLVERGLIDEATLARAIKLQGATEIRIGQVLVTLGAVSREDLNQTMRLKANKTLAELFSWTDGEFLFLDREIPKAPMLPVSLDVTRLMLESAQRADERRSGPRRAQVSLLKDLIEESVDSNRQEPAEIPPLPPPEPTAGRPAVATVPIQEPAKPSRRSPPQTAPLSLPVAEPVPKSPPEQSARTDSIPADSGFFEEGHAYQAAKLSRKAALVTASATLLVVIGLPVGYSFLRTNRDAFPETGVARIMSSEQEVGTPLADPMDSGGGSPLGEALPRQAEAPLPSASALPAVVTSPESGDTRIERLEQAQQLFDSRAKELEENLRAEYETELSALRRQLTEARPETAEREGSAVVEPAGAAGEATDQDKDQEEPRPDPAASGLPTDPEGVEESPRSNSGVVFQPVVSFLPWTEDLSPTAGPVPGSLEADAEFDLLLPSDSAVAMPTEDADFKLRDLEEPGPGFVPPRLLHRRVPRYPPLARRMTREATVTVRVLVDEFGKPRSVELAGPRAGVGFDAAALEAARQCEWVPASKDGIPASMWVRLTFEFRL
jgi:TonB family protein